MKRLQDGKTVKDPVPGDVKAFLQKNQGIRRAPHMTTPLRALAQKSLDAAVRRAQQADKG